MPDPSAAKKAWDRNVDKALMVPESNYHETLQITTIVLVNDETMSELTNLLHIMNEKRNQWNIFIGALYGHGHGHRRGNEKPAEDGSTCKEGDDWQDCTIRREERDEREDHEEHEEE